MRLVNLNIGYVLGIAFGLFPYIAIHMAEMQAILNTVPHANYRDHAEVPAVWLPLLLKI
jgi:hypothetical protein